MTQSLRLVARFVAPLVSVVACAVVFVLASDRMAVLSSAHAAAVGASKVAETQSRHEARGVVTGVSDGDTLHVLVDGQKVKVRLAEIDAPEKRQDWGRKSEQSLREMVGKREVTLQWSESDRYGRIVARVWVDGLDVNAEQVRRGCAWVYRQYAKDRSLIAAQEAARGAGIGLWSQPSPIEPWVWRKTSAEK